MKLVDKSAVLSEINRRIAEYKDMKIDSSYYDGMIASLEFFRDEFINTIEVKEVDLEDVAAVEWDDYVRKIDGEPNTAYMLLERENYIALAKHFFELGLKAQKGE